MTGMIKPDDVLRHLCAVLPRLTDRFSRTVPAKNAVINSDLMLSVDLEDVSEFVVGYGYGLQSLTMINPIVSCVQIGSLNDGLWRIETAQRHKFSTPSEFDTVYVDVSDWGECLLVRTIGSNQVVVKYTGAAPATGSVNESLGSELAVARCESIDGNNVKFSLSDGYWYECKCICDDVVSGMNITIVPTHERAVDVYTELKSAANKLWCFLVFGDRATVGKPSDSAGYVMQGRGGMNVRTITVSTDFDLLVFWPSENKQESARAQVNEANGEVYEVFEKALMGFSGITGHQFAPRESGVAKSQTIANYIHQYRYQAINERNTEAHGIQSNMIYWDVPIREFDIGFLIDAGDAPQSMRLSGNLNEE